MAEGTEKYIYSATVATTILNEERYYEVREVLVRNGLWDDSFEHLEEQVRYCALDTKL